MERLAIVGRVARTTTIGYPGVGTVDGRFADVQCMRERALVNHCQSTRFDSAVDNVFRKVDVGNVEAADGERGGGVDEDGDERHGAGRRARRTRCRHDTRAARHTSSDGEERYERREEGNKREEGKEGDEGNDATVGTV